MISPQLRHVAAFSLVFTSLTALPTAQADPAANTVELPQLEINGSRTAADQSILPQAAVIIGRHQLDRMPAENLADALRSIGGVVISNQSDSITGGASKIDIGGFGATASQNTLILLNGRRINTTDSSVFNLGSIPLSAIDHIEVLTGTGSVLYGNGATGGVVNVVTRSQYDDAGRIEATLGEHNTNGGSVQGSFNKGNLNGMVSAGRIGSDNYRKNNESRQTNFFGDLGYQQGPTSVSLTALYNKHQLGLPGGLPNTQLKKSPYAAATTDDEASSKTLHVLPSASYRFNDNLAVHLDTGLKVRKQTSEFLSGGTRTRDDTDRTLNISPRVSGNTTLGLPHRWTVGFDYYRTHYNLVSTSAFPAFPPFPASNERVDARFERSVQALYGQDSIALGDNTWLTLGARHEWIRTTESRRKNNNGTITKPKNIDDNNDETGMWSAGLRHHLSDKVSVFANAERSVRYATVDELTFWQGEQQQQTGTTYSIGGKWQSQGQYSTLTFWQGQYRHEIAFDPATFNNYNLDDTKRQGVSLSSYWKLDDTLWLAVSSSYQEAKFDKGKNKDHNVPLVPRVSGYVRLDWQPLEQLTLSVAERYQGKQYMDNDQGNDFGKRIPSYRFMDLSATFRPTGKKSVFITATLHNAENRKGAYDYAVASTSTPGNFNAYALPGRYLVVKAGVDF